MKKRVFIYSAFILFLTAANIIAQNKVEKSPVPICGMAAIQQNVKYPENAKANKVEGKVLIKAVINERGNVTKTEIIGEKRLGYGLEEAAQNAVKLTKFTPGLKDNQPVKSEVVVPILFKLK